MLRRTVQCGRWRLPALIAGLLIAGIGTALATTGNLPGGTAISTEITTPADGALIAYPTGNVQTEGTASVGEGTSIPDTTFVYVIDVSDSTSLDSGGDCGGDRNGDGESNTVLDCEVAAILTLNTAAIATGTVDEVGVAVFGEDGDAADMTPGGGDDRITAPDADSHVETVVTSVHHNTPVIGPLTHLAGITQFDHKDVGGDGTNFAAGLAAALSIVQASGNPNNVVIYLSDGDSNAGSLTDFNNALDDLVAEGAVIRSFAVGKESQVSCTGGGVGTLREMATRSGGSCDQIDDPADLPNDIVPVVIAAQLSSLSLRVDGGAPTDITASSNPALPVAGPNSVTYSHLVPGLMPNTHQICVTAAGSDGGGTGSVTDCAQVTVATIYLDPAEATNELGTPGQTHTVTAQVAAGPAGGVSGVTVSFDVFAGPNTGAGGSGTTDSSGNAAFTYTAKQGPAGLGTDFIEACFTDSQGNRACNRAMKHWVDTTAPIVGCTETVNPHGRKIPPAGSTTLPGPKGGQNEDGFYQLNAEDTLDSDPKIYLTDTGSGTVFGPFSNGTRIKYTEANGTNPRVKSIGSTRGRAGAVAVHLLGNGDASIHAVDASKNASDPVDCLVPQPPK